MKLSILVPHYNEPNAIIKKLFDSIALQRGIDFKDLDVFVCNDGFDHYIDREIDSQSILRLEADQKGVSTSNRLFEQEFPFIIHEINIKKSGISAVRNALLKAADGDYIMWCDCDDMFIDSLGVSRRFETIETTPVGERNCTFVEEVFDSTKKKTVYVKKENDLILIHGKVFNRKFLLDNNILWNPDLQIHEDSYFNILCSTLVKNARYMQQPYYLWCWNDKSISRKDPYYIINTYQHLLKSADALVAELLRRQKSKEATNMFAINLFQTFFLLTGIYTKDKNCTEKIANLNKLAKNYYDKYKELLKYLNLQEFNQLKMQMMNGAMQKGWYLETCTFNEWLSQIEKL